MQIIHTLLGVIQIAFAICLIFIVAIQQTKSEGLSGTIGGQVTSSFKGKPGFEERLTEYTRYIGVAFFFVSIVVALTTPK